MLSVAKSLALLTSVVGSVLVIVGMYLLLWGKSNDTKDIVMKQTQAAEEGADLP